MRSFWATSRVYVVKSASLQNDALQNCLKRSLAEGEEARPLVLDGPLLGVSAVARLFCWYDLAAKQALTQNQACITFWNVDVKHAKFL